MLSDWIPCVLWTEEWKGNVAFVCVDVLDISGSWKCVCARANISTLIYKLRSNQLHPWCAGKVQAPPVHEILLPQTPSYRLCLDPAPWVVLNPGSGAHRVHRDSPHIHTLLLLLLHPLPPYFLPQAFNRLRYSSSPRTRTESSRTPAHARDHVIRPWAQQQHERGGEPRARRSKNHQPSEYYWILRALFWAD